MNAVNSPERLDEQLVQLRRLIEEIDCSVLMAFGWDSGDLNYNFYRTRDGIRWTICEEARNDIFDRLLDLNYERHRKEIERGLVSDGEAGGNGRRSHATEDGRASMRTAIEDDRQTRLEV
jgi:hypothetical protein